jgi:hypothetical protein
MTPFVVDWDTSAEMQLADIWLHAADPKAVTQASARTDNLLEQDPVNNGQALSEGLFKLEVRPLIVYYTIDQVKRSVRVSDAFYRP